MNPDWLSLLPWFFLVALLYGAVGHGGASGYLAVMALASVAAETMRPVALTLNVLVSLTGTVVFFRAGHFAGHLFWPFTLAAMPWAWLGSRTDLPEPVFRLLLAAALAVAVIRLLWQPDRPAGIRRPPWFAVIVWGGVIGFASGLIGVGGGIFLTPLVLLRGWATPRTAAAVSAPFILANSATALLGQAASWSRLPTAFPWLALTVLAAGWLGARWGGRLARPENLRAALALVVAIAAVKLGAT